MFDLKAIHEKSSFHRAALAASPFCGCFYCLEIYAPGEIKEWVGRDGEQTAICPHCSIDAVLPSTEVDLTPALLKAMQARWFAPVHVLSAVTVEEAAAAKAILEKRLGQPPWLRGIKICEAAAGLHVVRVAVTKDSAELWDAIPQTIDGVRVIWDEVGAGAIDLERFFQEMHAGYARMTPQEMAEDAAELALWETTAPPLEPDD
jgi:hypothetical protein